MAVSAHRLKATARTDGRVAERLDGASRAIDGHFLGLGEILGQSVEGLGKLVASLDQIQGTLDPQLIAATTSELEAAARELLSLPDRHAERSGGARRLASTAERLAISIDDMRRTLAYLRVFAINIKITAGGIATAGREFGDFAQEISDCIELGRARLDKFEADLVRLRGGFKAAFAQEQAVTARFGGLLPSVPDGLTANAAAMVTHHQRIGQVAGEVATLARAVQKKTGAALSGLQVGDITRQRIEHVSEALGMLADVTGLSDDQAARMKTVIHGLLDAQLQAASEDFHNDVARISQAMAGLSADAREILRLRDVAQGRAGDDDRGFLHRIEAHLAQAQDLVADVGEADRQAAMLGASVSAAAIDLSAQIAALRTIKTDVQYMALNTTLKCGRLGDVGKPLAVIATELRLHAGAMDTAAQQALNALNALIEDAAHLSGAQSDPSETVSQSVGESLSQVALRLRTAGEQVDADLAEVAREGDAVVQGLDRAKSKMRFDDEIGAILEDAAADLAADVNDGAVDTDDLAEPLAELLARIAKRYTMKQERDVHQRMTGGLGLIAKSEAA